METIINNSEEHKYLQTKKGAYAPLCGQTASSFTFLILNIRLRIIPQKRGLSITMNFIGVPSCGQRTRRAKDSITTAAPTKNRAIPLLQNEESIMPNPNEKTHLETQFLPHIRPPHTALLDFVS